MSPGHLVLDGRRVAFWTAGSGTPVIFVHGSLATSATWRRTAATLEGTALRLIAPDLPGWGESEPEPEGCVNLLDYETRAIEAVARAQAAPVHLVGHSYGCNIVLLAALAERIPLCSLVLFEPTLVALLRQSGDLEAYSEIERFVDAYRRAHEAGDRRAVGTVIDLWGGPGSFDAMPENARNAIAAWVPRNLRHWTPAFQPGPAFERLHSIRLPTTVVVSERAHPAAKLIAQRLQERLTHCRIAEIAGANHFMIFTHPTETARIIRESCHGGEAHPHRH